MPVSGAITLIEAELVGQSKTTLAMRVNGLMPSPMRPGIGVGVVIHGDETECVLVVVDDVPADDGTVRFRRLPSND